LERAQDLKLLHCYHALKACIDLFELCILQKLNDATVTPLLHTIQQHTLAIDDISLRVSLIDTLFNFLFLKKNTWKQLNDSCENVLNNSHDTQLLSVKEEEDLHDFVADVDLVVSLLKLLETCLEQTSQFLSNNNNNKSNNIDSEILEKVVKVQQKVKEAEWRAHFVTSLHTPLSHSFSNLTFPKKV
jgi:hypothetical protein